MKRAIAFGGLVAVLAVGAAVLLAADESNPSTPEQKAPAMMCPCCRMTMGAKEPEATMQERMKEMEAKMKEAGVSEETMKMRQAMRHAPLFADSPDMLLGQAKTLGLSDEQKGMLEEILKEARAKALGVLTDDQRAKLGKIPEKPTTMTEMQGEMMKRMEPMMKNMMSSQMGGEKMK
jgi:hypothetical protein